MPLHLLGKKSWNVYNADNIARVKRDEADAAAREAAKEQRDQEADAERRLRILRGEQVEPPPIAIEADERGEPRHNDVSGRGRKRRRLTGEDDTERDIRYVQEDRARAAEQVAKFAVPDKSRDAPLTDSIGHINLFPDTSHKPPSSKNAEAEAEKARKQREFEDQYTMRFSNAAGFGQKIEQAPWYQAGRGTQEAHSDSNPPGKDVWGNEDPRRQERERMRIAADDPLAAMRKGAAAVRQLEKQRTEWNEDRCKELKSLEREQQWRDQRAHRRRDHDDLQGFSLDSPRHPRAHSRHDHKSPDEKSTRPHRHRSYTHDDEDWHLPHHRHRHRHRHQKRSHSRSPRRADTGKRDGTPTATATGRYQSIHTPPASA